MPHVENMTSSPPVDRQIRLRYAEILRRFAAVRISNDDYVDSVAFIFRSADPALRAIFLQARFFSGDLRENRLTDEHRLPREHRRFLARAIVFLHSSSPYEWPVTSNGRIAIGLLTLGLWGRLFPTPRGEGDRFAWPFLNLDQVKDASRRPRLLRGDGEGT